MVMMLPFLSALFAIWFTLRGNRPYTIRAWVFTFGVFLVWMHYHMTDKLNISL
jgi:hypothetical protein